MSGPKEDPVLQSSRREAIAVLITWLAALIYTVTYCYLNGYNREYESLTFVFGFPDWVFWGIVIPWAICVVLSYLFSYWFIRDEDFGGEEESDDFE